MSPRGKRSTLARSEIFFLEVKPFNEEYSLAQSQAMAGGDRRPQLESLIAAQKEIISATWNLERRSGAGRSRDVTSRPSATRRSELKARAEQAAGGQRPRRRLSQAPQQVSDAATDLPTSPVTAGDRRRWDARCSSCDDRQTAEAIPHEMAALNALLQAQAEVQRRQVTQQANGASARGNGRQGQDLSSLFDRELKRQQRTNYETRPRSKNSPTRKQGASALDRIRELAKRQEELSRQQRELAKIGALGRRDEARARKADARAGASCASRPTSWPGRWIAARAGARGAVRSAQRKRAGSRRASRCASAASELVATTIASAAARGEQAARELRSPEAQMQNATPDARRRALGELQLESQQAADAQRRIANEAQRIDRPGGSADASVASPARRSSWRIGSRRCGSPPVAWPPIRRPPPPIDRPAPTR